LNIAYQNLEFSKTLNRSDLVIADGIGPVWGSKILGGCELQKMTTADFYLTLFELLSRFEISVYMIGGKPGVARKAVEKLREIYPKISILGYADGYFIEKPKETVIQEIRTKKPKILFVGMGSPRQEYWIDNNYCELPSSVIWAVGALFDYIAGFEKRVPEYLNRINLEWLWRLMMDFPGKWQRYLIGNPLFLLRIMRERFSKGN
jgi:N-acetylglucosaminyldiphosphoundecaprenol N-acetyl-beta-D-mannosaminyltransferase